MAMLHKNRLGWMALVLCNLMGCGSEDPHAPTDTLESGTVHISADESFKPVIDSQVQVFESAYPDAKIIVHYKPEAECLKDLAVDSIRMVIATRGYTKAEEAFLVDSMKVAPVKKVVAYDAVAVIVNPQSPDTLFTMQEITDLLTGKSGKNLIPVFDGVKATSTVRFVIDSVLKGQSLSPNVVAANGSEAVIDYVARTRNAVGFLGVSWIGNRDDSAQLSYLSRIRAAQLEHPLVKSKFVTPAQYNIYYRRYPMVRDLVYVLKEKHNGLGHGFAYFMAGQRGQLIFKRAYLMPATVNLGTREATLTE